MCKEYCGSDYPNNNHLPVGELVYFHDRFDGDRYSLNPWKIVSVELKSGCVYYGLESGNTHTTVTGNSIRSYVDQLPKYGKEKPITYRLICSTHRKADGKKLAEFQEEYCNLLEGGVPPQEIVRNWNDSQDSFWNKVYLVEEKQ